MVENPCKILRIWLHILSVTIILFSCLSISGFWQGIISFFIAFITIPLIFVITEGFEDSPKIVCTFFLLVFFLTCFTVAIAIMNEYTNNINFIKSFFILILLFFFVRFEFKILIGTENKDFKPTSSIKPKYNGEMIKEKSNGKMIKEKSENNEKSKKINIRETIIIQRDINIEEN